jgi:thioredoxin reductase (NADPH)
VSFSSKVLYKADRVDLTKYASHVYVLVRKGELRASKIMAKRLVQHPKVTVMWNTVATECKGDGDLLQSLALQNTKTGETSELQVNGLFYAIGMSLLFRHDQN